MHEFSKNLREAKMTHAEFVNKYRNGEIKVHVDKDKAGFLYKSSYLIPQHLRTRQAIIRTFAFALFFIGIALFFFSPWWLALFVLFVGLPLFRVCQIDAAKGVLEASLTSPHVFEVALSKKVIFISEASGGLRSQRA